MALHHSLLPSPFSQLRKTLANTSRRRGPPTSPAPQLPVPNPRLSLMIAFPNSRDSIISRRA